MFTRRSGRSRRTAAIAVAAALSSAACAGAGGSIPVPVPSVSLSANISNVRACLADGGHIGRVLTQVFHALGVNQRSGGSLGDLPSLISGLDRVRGWADELQAHSVFHPDLAVVQVNLETLVGGYRRQLSGRPEDLAVGKAMTDTSVAWMQSVRKKVSRAHVVCAAPDPQKAEARVPTGC